MEDKRGEEENNVVVEKPFTYSNRNSTTPSQSELRNNRNQKPYHYSKRASPSPSHIELKGHVINLGESPKNSKNEFQKKPYHYSNRLSPSPSQNDLSHKGSNLNLPPQNKPYTYSNRSSINPQENVRGRNSTYEVQKGLKNTIVEQEQNRLNKSPSLPMGVREDNRQRVSKSPSHPNLQTSPGRTRLNTSIDNPGRTTSRGKRKKDTAEEFVDRENIIVDIQSFRERRETTQHLNEHIGNFGVNITKIEKEPDRRRLTTSFSQNKDQIEKHITELNDVLDEYERIIKQQEEEIIKLKKTQETIKANPKLLNALKNDLVSTVKKYNQLVDRYNALKASKAGAETETDRVNRENYNNMKRQFEIQVGELEALERENEKLKSGMNHGYNNNEGGSDTKELANLRADNANLKAEKETNRNELIRLNEDHQHLLTGHQKTVQLMKAFQEDYKRVKFENLLYKQKLEEVSRRTGMTIEDPTTKDTFEIEYQASFKEIERREQNYKLHKSDLSGIDHKMGNELLSVLDYKFKVGLLVSKTVS